MLDSALLAAHLDRPPGGDVLAAPGRSRAVTARRRLPAGDGQSAPWPDWVPETLVTALARQAIDQPWLHQRVAAEHAWAGRSVIVSTGTASGKSLAYLLPTVSALLTGPDTALYLAPTKSLAADQLRVLDDLALDLPAVCCDGDSSFEERDWARRHGRLLLTNPDMLHRGILPSHRRWQDLIRRLRFVVVDECHSYRGVFGSHVAGVLRRLARVCAGYGTEPCFVLCSASVDAPATFASRLVGHPVVSVAEDWSPRAERTIVLCQAVAADRRDPAPADPGAAAAADRPSTVAATAELLTDLVTEGNRTLAFVQSRRGAEALAQAVRTRLRRIAPDLVDLVGAYRGGFLPEERRDLERRIRDGRLLGLATTSALELGVDVTGLDAVVMAGYPGTRSSFWQRAGRAGRRGRPALVVLVAGDDPLDTYLVQHPEALLDHPYEATVIDPENPYVVGPHLCAAAAELPLRDNEVAAFGAGAAALADDLVAQGLLRRRAAGLFWVRRERPHDLIDIRGSGSAPTYVVEVGTGRVLGTVDAASAQRTVHPGAVYVHQGRTYLVDELDLEMGVALARSCLVDYDTAARRSGEIEVLGVTESLAAGGATLSWGSVRVSRRVEGYVRRDLRTRKVRAWVRLDLPTDHITTKAVWWTLDEGAVRAAGVDASNAAAHAAEHAALGMMPLVATCDRWDVGGMSTARHPQTGGPTVFVHDDAAGGAGLSERAFGRGIEWLTAALEVIRRCPCERGCPSCVQSSGCGRGNTPLDKVGGAGLLEALLARLAPVDRRPGHRPGGGVAEPA